MEWVTTTGRTVEEAKDAALDELGVDEADAEFELLEEPRQGLFGRQRGEARVRARVRPTAPRPKLERRGKGRRRGAESNVRSDVEASESSRESSRESRESSGDSSRELSRAAAPRAAASSAPKRRRKSQDTTREVEPVGGGGRPSTASTNGGSAVPEQELSITEQGQIAETFVIGLLQTFGAPAQTTVVAHDEETVEVQVAGNDLGLLIGPKGQTLQAMQELTRTVVQRRSVARTGRILVDVAGYRMRRKEALGRFTHQVAQDVIATGEQRGLEPMNAADRKVVHDTVNDLDGVRTVSEGEEPRRRVIIIPDPTATAGAPAPSAASSPMAATSAEGD